MKSLYFLGYAFMATTAVTVIAWAQYSRMKSEGVPLNKKLILVTGGVALAFWTAAALAEFVYEITPFTAAFAAFCFGIIFSAVFAWEIGLLMKKISEDEGIIKELATRDALTGLWNMRIFRETLHAEVVRAKRFNADLSLLMVDIDDFAVFNKQYGFIAGDKALSHMSTSLQDAVRTIDHVCRTGGDEVAIILPGTDKDAAHTLAARILDLVSSMAHEVGDGKTAAIAVSIGVSSYSNTTNMDQDMIIEARNSRKNNPSRSICESGKIIDLSMVKPGAAAIA